MCIVEIHNMEQSVGCHIFNNYEKKDDVNFRCKIFFFNAKGNCHSSSSGARVSGAPIIMFIANIIIQIT